VSRNLIIAAFTVLTLALAGLGAFLLFDSRAVAGRDPSSAGDGKGGTEAGNRLAIPGVGSPSGAGSGGAELSDQERQAVREALEKVAREGDPREAKLKLAREKLTREKSEREAQEKQARERIERDALDQLAREGGVHQALMGGVLRPWTMAAAQEMFGSCLRPASEIVDPGEPGAVARACACATRAIQAIYPDKPPKGTTRNGKRAVERETKESIERCSRP
jgi:uncharacterized protein (DUF4415 family)